LARDLSNKLEAALSALNNCKRGAAFVDNPTSSNVKAAMDAINDLNDQLAAGATWAATVK
jgi:hypothetical protein